MQWEGTLPAGRVVRQPVISLDVYATASTAAQAPVPGKRQLDGVDLIPFLLGEKTIRPHERLYWRLHQKAALRLGDWKLVRNRRGRAVAPWELYDLSSDISETNNLASREPDRLEQLKDAWQELDDQMIEPIFIPRR